MSFVNKMSSVKNRYFIFLSGRPYFFGKSNSFPIDGWCFILFSGKSRPFELKMNQGLNYEEVKC